METGVVHLAQLAGGNRLGRQPIPGVIDHHVVNIEGEPLGFSQGDERLGVRRSGRHRLFHNSTVVTLLLVDFIMPDVPVKRTDQGRIGRALLRAEAIRVGFVAENSVRSVYHITVHMTVLHTRDKTRPNRVIFLCALHGEEVIPPGYFIDHRTTFGMWCPDAEASPLYAVYLRRMRTEVFIGFIIRAQMEGWQRKVYFFLLDGQIRCFFLH